METRNLRQPSIKRNQINERVTSIKDGPSTKLSGLTLRARARAPLAELSTNNGRNNFEVQDGPIITNKQGVSFQVYQDDSENTAGIGEKNKAKKHCVRTHNQTKENTSQGYNKSHLNQPHKHFQNSSDENKPPPAKIPNTKASPTHSMNASYFPNGRNQIPSITTSAKPSFVIHQDDLSPKDNLLPSKTGFNFGGKNVLNTFKETSSTENITDGIEISKALQPTTADINSTNIDQIISRTSAAEFRNSCNESIRSTSSPATDIYDRDSEVYSLLHQNNELLENEAPMDDEATIQEISGASEEEPEIIKRPPQAVPESVLESDEYSADILAHVKRTELNNLPKWNYMTKQPDITFPMRAILVDWLVEVSEEYKLHTETIFLAVNYIDRFLSYMSVQRARLQLVGTACMFIAAKYEEIYPPDVTEFVYITDDTYTKKQVLRMEQLVLGVLEFNVTVPTSFFFANHFSKMAGSNDKTTSLARYLTELTLLDADTYLPFVPSIIGASAVALARHTLGFAAWDANMVRKTGYPVDDIRNCLIALHGTFSQATTGPQQAIVEKYKQQKHHGVSEVEPTPIF